MIRYALRCEAGHDFDGWFRSSEAFDAQQAAGRIECVRCGSPRIAKAPMAPSVAARAAPEAVPDPPPVPESPAPSPAEQALAELRAHVEAHSDYVGMRFVAEARAMHEGRVPHRPIHGEARPDEARKLIEEGLPVAPLPFLPKQRMN